MFRFLKGLGKREELPAGLGVDDLSAWIDTEEARVRADLSGRAAGHRQVLLGARSRMEEILSGFDTTAREETAGTKLAGVTERSLPLFLRAMATSLSRELPEDPEGFYTAAGEVLKGCLSAFRGQGRYLASRFPGEMKALRDGIDAMGREVNAMTPEIARVRERLRELSVLRGSLNHYEDEKKRLVMTLDRIHGLEDEEARSRSSLEAALQALADLEKGEEFRAYEGELSRIRALEDARSEAERRFRALAATATHLLTKGGKIASRKRDRDAARSLEEAGDLLVAGLPVPEEGASRVLPPAQRALTALVTSGDLTPKNRDEIDLLEKPDQLLVRLTDLSRKFQEITGEIGHAQDALRALPVSGRRTGLVAEVEDLKSKIARAGNLLVQARRDARDLDGRLGASLEEIRRKAEALSGRPFQTGDRG
jgi:hypothetical protein